LKDETLKIYGALGRNKLGYVNAYLMCSNPKIDAPIRFYVDTGASRTTIADRDAIRIGIDHERLEESKNPIIGIGCTKIKNYLLRNVMIVFRESENSFHVERLSFVTILKHEPKDAEEQAIVDQCPSLLGVDLLAKYSVRFTTTKVILEK
jgi:hypothetical protein